MPCKDALQGYQLQQTKPAKGMSFNHKEYFRFHIVLKVTLYCKVGPVCISIKTFLMINALTNKYGINNSTSVKVSALISLNRVNIVIIEVANIIPFK